MPPSLCVLTAYDPRFKDLASISVPSMRHFADAHGYSLRVVERVDSRREGGWIKIEPIIEALGNTFDFVLWIDADTFIPRRDVDIRHVTRPDIHLHMVWHELLPKPDGDLPHFNTGVMLIRASDWSRKFFERVWKIGPLSHEWNDQAAIHHALGLDGVLRMGIDRVDEPDRRCVSRMDLAWNSIPGVCSAKHPIIRHYAGISDIAGRVKLMRENLAGGSKP